MDHTVHFFSYYPLLSPTHLTLDLTELKLNYLDIPEKMSPQSHLSLWRLVAYHHRQTIMAANALGSGVKYVQEYTAIVKGKPLSPLIIHKNDTTLHDNHYMSDSTPHDNNHMSDHTTTTPTTTTPALTTQPKVPLAPRLSPLRPSPIAEGEMSQGRRVPPEDLFNCLRTIFPDALPLTCDFIMSNIYKPLGDNPSDPKQQRRGFVEDFDDGDFGAEFYNKPGMHRSADPRVKFLVYHGEDKIFHTITPRQANGVVLGFEAQDDTSCGSLIMICGHLSDVVNQRCDKPEYFPMRHSEVDMVALMWQHHRNATRVIHAYESALPWNSKFADPLKEQMNLLKLVPIADPAQAKTNQINLLLTAISRITLPTTTTFGHLTAFQDINAQLRKSERRRLRHALLVHVCLHRHPRCPHLQMQHLGHCE